MTLKMLFDNTCTDDIEKPLLFDYKGCRLYEIYLCTYDDNIITLHPRNNSKTHIRYTCRCEEEILINGICISNISSEVTGVSHNSITLHKIIDIIDVDIRKSLENDVLIDYGRIKLKIDAIEITNNAIICMIE